ncbi:hypothetical protein DFH06DRAFT_1223596 [Mycena polygramma]|nr:hypothetical protein DFH06DRAFT_1223596 [Mycena polygramma]
MRFLFPSRAKPKLHTVDALPIALRTTEILDVIAEAVPDASDIPPLMVESIENFALLLEAIEREVKVIAAGGRCSTILHLNRNEGAVGRIKAQLDNAYRDVVAASVIRNEVAQFKTQLAVTALSAETAASTARIEAQQKQTFVTMRNVSTKTKNIETQLSEALFQTRLSVFLAIP